MKNRKSLFLILLSLFLVIYAWIGRGFDALGFDTDFGRDLMEISNIQAHHVVWLGPWLGPGFHATSLYYYLFYPAVALAHGHPYAMIWFNVLLFLVALILLAIRLYPKFHGFTAILILTIGLSPWMIEAGLHPGNGFTYAAFSLIAFTGLLYGGPSIISSASAGFATAFHPAAFLLIPSLVKQWWKRRTHLLNLSFAVIAFLFAWGPLIAFEIITKGYIIRSFLKHPSTGILSFGIGLQNLNSLSRSIDLSAIILIGLLAFNWMRIFLKKDLLSLEFVILNVVILFISLLHGVPERYFFTIDILIFFSLIVPFAKHRIGQWLILIYVIFLVFDSPIFKPFPLQTRTVPPVLQTVDVFTQNYSYLKNKKLATVASLSLQNEVPQADDYRALLRNHGFQVVDITQNSTADYLIMFIEERKMLWQTWSSWEISQFGAKQLVGTTDSPFALIVVYSKQ